MPDNWIWTDDLVKDCVSFLTKAFNNPNSYNNGKWEGLHTEFDKWKAKKSKENYTPKDWEILSYKSFYCGKDNVIFTKQNDHRFYPTGNSSGYDEQFLLEQDPNIEIHSVERLSDEVTFKIGDYFNYHLRPITSPIKEFIIDGNSMKVKADGILAPMELEFISIREKTKVPLFITEDDVEIFDCDYEVFGIGEKFDCYNKLTANVVRDMRSDWKWFSTKEKRNEYILLNKPTLVTYKECHDAICKSGNYYKNLELVFRSKINP